MIVDFDKASPEAFYKILIGSVLPRPIAWVSTINREGVPNLAPFSFFTVASSNPPVLCFAPALKFDVFEGTSKGKPKDTLKNIQDTGEFVVNIVSQELAEKMNQSSGSYPPGVNEFEKVGLTTAPSSRIAPPRVAESLINFECKLHQVISFGEHPGAGNLVLGRIQCAHLHESVYKNGRVDLDVLHPIGRLAGMEYCEVKDRFVMVRPEV
ncbi:MAG TPA: flavin reductase family protein [Candidatus Melainabacteria bacterium]|nr:flavin reductase family protein [Candidatus Melainabacteria bacterium]HIN65043.1 flavin reductase family protein [Candidatus Obscuribacterales bacterium]